MRVYLVQHGESKSEEVDPQRRLTDKGIGEVQNVAFFLRSLKLAVDAIWHSDKERAQQTGDLLAGAVWARDRLVQPEGLGPKDSEKNEIVEFRFGGVVCVERRETNLAGELEQFLKTGREVKEYGRDIAKAEQLEL